MIIEDEVIENDKFRRCLQDVKQIAQEGYKQSNFYRFEDILERIGKLENDDSPLNFS